MDPVNVIALLGIGCVVGLGVGYFAWVRRPASEAPTLSQVLGRNPPPTYARPPAPPVVAPRQLRRVHAGDPRRWVVHTKGRAGDKSFEIAVLRADNSHGIESYGWFGENKLLISHNGGPCDWPVTRYVWGELIGVASRVASHLNQEEEQ